MVCFFLIGLLLINKGLIFFTLLSLIPPPTVIKGREMGGGEKGAEKVNLVLFIFFLFIMSMRRKGELKREGVCGCCCCEKDLGEKLED